MSVLLELTLGIIITEVAGSAVGGAIAAPLIWYAARKRARRAALPRGMS